MSKESITWRISCIKLRAGSGQVCRLSVCLFTVKYCMYYRTVAVLGSRSEAPVYKVYWLGRHLGLYTGTPRSDGLLQLDILYLFVVAAWVGEGWDGKYKRYACVLGRMLRT